MEQSEGKSALLAPLGSVDVTDTVDFFVEIPHAGLGLTICYQ
jgi:hypothetical protein